MVDSEHFNFDDVITQEQLDEFITQVFCSKLVPWIFKNKSEKIDQVSTLKNKDLVVISNPDLDDPDDWSKVVSN